MKKDNNNKDVLEKIKEYFSKNGIVSFVILILIIIYFAKSSGIMSNMKGQENNYIPYDTFMSMVKNGKVDYVFMTGPNSSSVQFLPSKEYLDEKGVIITSSYSELIDFLSKTKETSIEESTLPMEGNLKYVTENPNSSTFKEELLKQGNLRVFTIKTSGTALSIFLYILQMFLPIILLFVFFSVMQKRMEPADNEIKIEIPDTKFRDIAGYEALKNDSKFILDFLKNPKDYEEIGARLPNGVLFYGPPGTGKTLMARAIAGEASVPFYKVNGSDFVELYVGLGARRVRKLYKTARSTAPCIVFIDEIDSIGAARGNFRGSSEDDKTLTALLNELDGFSAKAGVITIAATNRLQDLDPALIRPGRFDRHVAVPLPDREEREMILNLYIKDKKISKDISMKTLADRTISFSPSELENLLNEAAINAVTQGREKIEQEDIDESFLKIIIKGNKKENKHQSEKEKKIIAYHEAGHAVVGHMQGTPVLEVSVVGTTSGAGGYTLSQPEEGLKSKAYMKNEIRELYAGRAAETLIAEDEDDITVGAVSDIERATMIISGYMKHWGLNGSLINLSEFGVDEPSEDMIKEAEKIADELFEETKNILKENRDKLDRLAETLLDKKTVNAEEFLQIMNGKTSDDLRENKKIAPKDDKTEAKNTVPNLKVKKRKKASSRNNSYGNSLPRRYRRFR